ncbi:hypothetical protein ACI2K4_02795 [Micromonospora sp. NPDC050397]|uniref:hypothetical protein n=1 Tax=Micromonospora sp. NPDC050397 TaxID=3364279 RepID=UPI0038514F4A
MTAAADTARRTPHDDRPVGVPDLDEVTGEWVDADDLAHLPSLRNQRGQGHVNHDLTSLSWLAAPPYSFGYHTGVLRLDGTVLDAHRFRWKPWGVQREHRDAEVSVRTDTRMALGRDLLLWRVEVTNEQAQAVTYQLDQELFALLGEAEVGWGWLYDVPWSNGDYHDFITLERIRDNTRPGRDGSPYLLGPGPRRVRLGRPRLPGIQRDEDSSPMLMRYELPRHVSQDTVYPHRSAVPGVLRNLRCGTDEEGGTLLDLAGPVELAPDTQVDLDEFELRDGLLVSFEFRPETLTEPGVILTHGNHPDSLQLGIDADGLWVGISGETAYADTPLRAGEWHTIAVVLSENQATLLLDGWPVARTGHWTRSDRWRTTVVDNTVRTADGRSAARAAYAFSTAPTELTGLGAGARATWSLTLAPGETRTIGVVCAYGTDADEVLDVATRTAAGFDEALDETEHGTRRLWRNMFTPGNEDFSGHLPTFEPDDPKLGRAYYMGALLVLYMRTVRASPTEPVFLTGGPRLGPTTTFYWDHTEWSRMYALLEPSGLRAWLLRALAGPYRDSFGFDTRHGGPLGNEYASTDYALFRLVEHYVCVTGELAFLDEPAGTDTVGGHLERLAHGWRDRRRAATGGVLADFGDDAWRVLECVPNYLNVIASLNAGYVAMMRSLAELFRLRGREEEADRALEQAGALAAGVLGLYVPGGRWSVRHPEHTDTIGHVLDFGLVASAMHADLSPTQRAEMVDFVSEHLLTGAWMRALSLDDPVAASSDRPDHGAGGAFGAWPGVTAHGLAKLGRPDLAVAVLRATPDAASGGLWGQAMEIVDRDPDRSGRPDRRDPANIRVRVAERGVSNRDSIAGAATAEAVLSALFDVNPTFADLGGAVVGPGVVRRPGVGVLSHLNVAPVRPATEPYH